MARKELAEGCDGSILCRVPDHVRRPVAGQRLRSSHITLTDGQKRTLYERRMAARKAEQERDA